MRRETYVKNEASKRAAVPQESGSTTPNLGNYSSRT
jgi:hypothetical protein